ncbi:GAF domain-containing protein [Bordetella genomosp. 5]|uniref:GAF domain-containing protein n=1 Tax=Bordetella genomosp. 5 TaxID=1395608 RepID=A0A261TZY6_9BORD|nr:GAF domain-containing protein [Bordetella genomosp. 5]OZI55258.1 GAF domain-containing protein [Bordetella genomosp. 5]
MSAAFQPWAAHARSLALAQTREGQWDAISALLEQAFGYQLLTALVYLEDLRLMRRLYTNDETISPLGGFKATGNGPWSRKVLDQGEFSVASTEDDVRTVFSEAEFLIERGLHSAFNIPVRHQGKVIGSLNLLAGRHAYDHADLDLATVIAGLCAPVFLQAVEAARAEALAVDRTQLDSV